MCKCKKCGKFTKETESFNKGRDKYCSECVINKIMSAYGASYNQTYRHLERTQFGNGSKY